MSHLSYGPIPKDFMTNTENRLSGIYFDEKTNRLEVLDQLLLPHRKEFITIRNCFDAFSVIQNMQVRGAPLIAVVGALGLLIELENYLCENEKEFTQFVRNKIKYLIESRPTAINLQNAMSVIIKAVNIEGKLEEKKQSVIAAIRKIYHDEQEENRRLIWNGYQEISSLKPRAKKFTLMTICNTGALATCSWGTALGVIRALHMAGKLEMVYVLETRPYNQGLRLTASELRHGNVPFKVITDSMAAWTMKKHNVDAILVGADQVALNGDTANKIGTYMLSVLAKYHGVSFYPVVPITSINRNRESGDDIPIEERPSKELLAINGVFIGPEDTPVWNPAFDITPGELITKIITDIGNFQPKELRRALNYQ